MEARESRAIETRRRGIMVDENLPPDHRNLMEGFTVFTNSDGHQSILLNYRAATDKSINLKDINYQREIQGLLPLESLEAYFHELAEEAGGIDSPRWQEEMENNPKGYSKGLAAYYAFNKAFHTSQYPGIVPGAALHCSIDFGFHHPCIVIGQSESSKGFMRMHLHSVYRGVDIELKTFLNTVLSDLDMKFPGCAQIWYCVQEGVLHEGGGTSDKTPLQVMNEMGLSPRRAYHRINDGIMAVNEALADSYVGTPVVTVNPKSRDLCEMLDGGYRRRKITKDGRSVPSKEYVKDGWHDHVSDALRPIFYCFFKPAKMRKKGNSYRPRMFSNGWR